MAIDFEQEYGVNAGYVQELFEDWRNDPDAVEESLAGLCESRLAAAQCGWRWPIIVGSASVGVAVPKR